MAVTDTPGQLCLSCSTYSHPSQGTAQHSFVMLPFPSPPRNSACPLPPPQMATSCPSCFTHPPSKHCLKPPLAAKKDLNSCRLWGQLVTTIGQNCHHNSHVHIDMHTLLISIPDHVQHALQSWRNHTLDQTHAHFHTFGIHVMQHIVICSQAVAFTNFFCLVCSVKPFSTCLNSSAKAHLRHQPLCLSYLSLPQTQHERILHSAHILRQEDFI